MTIVERGTVYTEKLTAEERFGALGNKGFGAGVGAGLHPCVFGAAPAALGNAAPVADTWQGYPCVMQQGRFIGRIGVAVQTAAAQNARVAVYRTRGAQDYFPGQLIAETAAFSVNALGFQHDDLDFRIPRTDLYWFFFNLDALGLLQLYGIALGQLVTPFGYTDANPPLIRTELSAALAFGAAPTTFPTGAFANTDPALCAFMLVT